MTINLYKYQIKKKIQAGITTTVYQGYDLEKQRSVVIKVLNQEHCTLKEIARLRREHEITRSCNCQGIIKSYNLERCQNSYALILEDFGGRSLKQCFASKPIELKEFLRLAIALVEILNELHKIPIIHKDINPSNIVMNPETGEIKIIDFGIASRLFAEYQTVDSANLLEGTLAYISPEQTSRMNRYLDYRSDYYSLGATFYEMLTLKVPFSAGDAIEIIHAHLAKDAIAPHQINVKIPKTISAIVMKLLAKNAEDRYQSATGIKTDLQICRSQLETTGIIVNFDIAKRDRETQLLIPQKLYGREKEIQTLIEAFERVTKGACELILISGYSGIGKTAVVDRVRQPVIKARGYFLAGKFEQFGRNIPYSAIASAFAGLIKQILTESDRSVALWKKRFLDALGSNGKAIVDVIPEVATLLDKQQDIPRLEASESQRRFERVFEQFIDAIALPESPLVLFLDDLQWADSGSLRLLQLLLGNRNRQNLLVVGAYRDNEVEQTHLLRQTVEILQAKEVRIHQLVVKPLEKEQVEHFLADTLGEERESVAKNPFSELIFQKTQGNPFFLIQLLKTLYAEKLLVRDNKTGSWQWELNKIQAVGIADRGIVELMARNLSKLPETTQQILQLAACLGNQFSLVMLANVCGRSPFETAALLGEALQMGLILPLSNAYQILPMLDREEVLATDKLEVDYKFLHDRVQQATYCLIPAFERKATHLKIARSLLQETNKISPQEQIFALVNQFNFSLDLLTHQDEKERLAELNLIAGQQAKMAFAYEVALKYFKVGLQLLGENSWSDRYDITMSLYRETIEAKYLNSHFERANVLSEIAIEKAQNLLDKARVYELAIQAYIAQNKMQAAIDLGLKILQLLEVRPQQKPLPAIKIEQLAMLPEIERRDREIVLRILNALFSASVITNPTLASQITFTAIAFSMQHGNSSFSAIAYSNYGMLLCGRLGQIKQGYQFGQLALRLLEKFHYQGLKCRIVGNFNSYIRHWQEPIRDTLEPLLEALNSGLETGDLEYSGYAILSYLTHLFWLGKNLKTVEQEIVKYLALLKKLNLQYHVIYAEIGRQSILNLLGESQEKQLAGKSFNSSNSVPALIEKNNRTALFCVYFSEAIAAYLFNDPSLSLVKAQEAEKYESSVPGFVTVVAHNFYYSLALLACYSSVESWQQKEYFKKVISNQEKLKYWADCSPDNFKARYELIEAEKARILDQNSKVEELYRSVILEAQKQEQVQIEALTNELATDFYLANKNLQKAREYAIAAYDSYLRWGAMAKARDLEKKYQQFLDGFPQEPNNTIELKSMNDSTCEIKSETLDLLSVVKASQAISQEILLDRLLEKLTHIILENAGAQKIFLILSKNEKLFIEVAASANNKGTVLQQSIPLDLTQSLSKSIVNYVARTKEFLVLRNASEDSLFASDPYIEKRKPKSILSVPLINKNQLIGIIYLENNLLTDAFKRDRIELLNLLAPQIAISLENARLYQCLQQAQAKERMSEQYRKVLVKEKELNELKSRFITMASHEFRTPLTTIMGSVELIKHYGRNWNEEKRTQYLERIQNTVQHMTELLEDVLLLGKAEANKLDFKTTLLDLPQFCGNLIEELKIGIKDAREIAFSCSGQSEPILVDEKLLGHILGNLLSNAIKYSPIDTVIDFKLIFKDTSIIFLIQDRGIGISEEDLKQLFEPFHRGSNVGKIAGTGLGLAIVKKSVEKHSGEIAVRSKVGEGTIVEVAIPIQKEK
jgi:predicted ATPase/signal transduction histidine kinase/tRNA A-37 threonylcarbamoyl transferase component Bud32